MTKKILAVLFLPLLIASFLSAQSLAELSKKEKERRAAIKGKGTVVTNDDLSKVKKKPAVSTGQPAETGEETGTENPEAAAPPAVDSAPPVDERPTFPIISPGTERNVSDGEYQQTKTNLEENLSKAIDMVDLLTMKMNALWQQFYNMDTMETRDKVQLEISETYNKLLKAQEAQVRAEEELNSYVSRPRN